MASTWQDVAVAKRDAILALIPDEWHIADVPSTESQKDVTGRYIEHFLPLDEQDITNTDAVGIAENVAAGKWSAVQVTKAFCHRAAIAHQLLNCLHEIFFDAAIADAKALDEYLAKNGKPVGPLHGVPVSLKDQFHVRGVETTMGYVGWIGTFEGAKDDPRRGSFESEMVRELRECGAVLYCKTSVPHTLMSGETINNIIGYTWNPKNRYLTAGGSSGGEGALIGIRGSPIGLGSDIGGSIRIPAGFNGLYGLRPTSGRLPYEGTANSMDGQNSVLSVLGPIATTARGMRLLTKSLLSTKPWLYDPLVVEMPWRTAEEEAINQILKQNAQQRLSFGVYKHDGVVTVNPPVMRAVDLLVATLEKAGHQVIEWQPPTHTEINNIVVKAWLYDGGADVHGAFGLSGEDVSAQVQQVYGTQIQTATTASEIAANNVAKRQRQKQYLDYWNSTVTQTSTGRPVDAIICPLAPFPAARPGTYNHYGYSMWVNGLDYTSVVVPVTTADKTVDLKSDNFKALNDLDQAAYDNYDADIFDGAHVSLQLIGRRYTEERMIAIAEHVGWLLGK